MAVTYTAGAGETNNVVIQQASSPTHVMSISDMPESPREAAARRSTRRTPTAGASTPVPLTPVPWGPERLADLRGDRNLVHDHRQRRYGERHDFDEWDRDVRSGQGAPRRSNGEDGDDTLTGGSNNDTVDGGAGADTLSGAGNNDTVNGGFDGDIVKRRHGNDTLNGGHGDDTPPRDDRPRHASGRPGAATPTPAATATTASRNSYDNDDLNGERRHRHRRLPRTGES